jgi:restriction endonuclease S subunit
VVIPENINDQTAIANYLDRKTAEIDELIAQKERLLELYEEEKTAIINQAVTKGIDPDVKLKDSGIDWLGEIPEGWEVKKFKYLFELITERDEFDLPKIGLENIESETGKYITTDTDFEGEGIHFKVGDILFGKLRPYLAKVYLAIFEGKAVGDFYVFRCNKPMNEKYASKLIISKKFIDFSNGSTFGSKMPRVAWDFIANLEIAYPPLSEQLAIVHYIETETARINAKIAKTKRIIELQKEYRTALISEVVTGKIKVTQEAAS